MWPVEFGREESRSRLQDLVRPPQLGVLPLQLLDLGLRVGRDTRPVAGIDLSPANPRPDRLRRTDTEHPRHRRHRGILARIIGPHLGDHTDSALTKQYQALLGTENVQIVFTDDGIVRLAEIAFSVNERVENIGARRLYTVMEKLLEDLGFEATQYQGQTIYIDAAYVDARLTELSQNEDIRRYVL